jgi:ectoine hydroxylase-related dioxygenase (phytanoyl-CoA dioxygenase family)
VKSLPREARLLPGVPVVASPFFEEIVAGGYFDAWEVPLARSLRELGYAVFDFPDAKLAERASRIRSTLEPLFAAARKGGERFAGRLAPPRFQDALDLCDDVAAIARNESLLQLLSRLYGRAAFPFQTLNFDRGSQQHFHNDAVHFHSDPEGFMCGVWVALEDVTAENGPLLYYPGSHRWSVYGNEHITSEPRDLLRPASQSVFESLWRELVRVHRAEKEIFLPKKGQALIWAAGLLHGGERIDDPSLSRWSQVTHYFFEECAYYTPMASHRIVGKIAFREPVDLRTGQPVASRYAGRTLAKDFVAACRERQLIQPGEIEEEPLPPDFDRERYLRLHPDVAEAGMDPVVHYRNHGRYEGRRLR